ncbi:MAG: tyrosine-type recombinase/integrase, partial [Oligoflexia bacterium]|nr:tyrosine-type recombinase/integrase [Oligoflexia bacterium]
PWRGTHICRHTFATMALYATKDLPSVQAHLGHTTPQMTERYAKLAKMISADTAEKTAKVFKLFSYEKKKKRKKTFKSFACVKDELNSESRTNHAFETV